VRSTVYGHMAEIQNVRRAKFRPRAFPSMHIRVAHVRAKCYTGTRRGCALIHARDAAASLRAYHVRTYTEHG